MFGIDASVWGAMSAIVVAFIGTTGLIWKSHREAKAGALRTTINGCVALINELQQERDTNRKNYEQQRAEMLRSIARCDRRGSTLQARMSMLVTHVRNIEAFLRNHHLYERSPKFDWEYFYKQGDRGPGD